MSEPKSKIASLKQKYLGRVGMVQTSIYLDEETLKALIKYCKKHREKKSTVMKIALMKLFADTSKN